MKGRIKLRICILLYSLRDLLFPRSCIICGKVLEIDEKQLCNECRYDIPLTYFWDYSGNAAERRMVEKTDIALAVSLFFYRETGGYNNIIRKFKYDGRICIGREFGKMLGIYMAKSGRFDNIDAVVPVPLHLRKKRKRGFNQSEIIAYAIAEAFQSHGKKVFVFPEMLVRTRYTKSQTLLELTERNENVKNAFTIAPHVIVSAYKKGVRHILLTDDVLTSGSTLSACAAQLLPFFRVSTATLGFVE